MLRVPEAAPRVQRVADRLDSWILPVSCADVHITVWVAGFPVDAPAASDEIRPADLVRALEVLRGWPSPRLSIRGSNAFRSAVFCSVLDEHGDLAALRTELAAHLPPEVRFGPLVPHVTVGRFARVCETETIATLLEPLRDLPPLPCRPTTLDWVALDATRDDPPLRTVAQIPLELT